MDHLLSMEKESQRNLAYEKRNQKVVKARSCEVKFLFSFEGLGD